MSLIKAVVVRSPADLAASTLTSSLGARIFGAKHVAFRITATNNTRLASSNFQIAQVDETARYMNAATSESFAAFHTLSSAVFVGEGGGAWRQWGVGSSSASPFLHRYGRLQVTPVALVMADLGIVAYVFYPGWEKDIDQFAPSVQTGMESSAGVLSAVAGRSPALGNIRVGSQVTGNAKLVGGTSIGGTLVTAVAGNTVTITPAPSSAIVEADELTFRP